MKARPGRAPRVCLAAIVFLITGPLTPTAQDPARPPIDEFVATLQVKYDSVRDFSANFTHTYAGGVLRTTLTEYGTVHVKKAYVPYQEAQGTLAELYRRYGGP